MFCALIKSKCLWNERGYLEDTGVSVGFLLNFSVKIRCIWFSLASPLLYDYETQCGKLLSRQPAEDVITKTFTTLFQNSGAYHCFVIVK